MVEGLRFISWNILKVICIFLMSWDPMGGWVFFYDLGQLFLERMLELEMLNPKP